MHSWVEHKKSFITFFFRLVFNSFYRVGPITSSGGVYQYPQGNL